MLFLVLFFYIYTLFNDKYFTRIAKFQQKYIHIIETAKIIDKYFFMQTFKNDSTNHPIIYLNAQTA